MPFAWVEPAIKESINRLTYTWADMDLLITADRITDAGSAELWFHHNNGSGQRLLHTAKVNLLSTSVMTQIAKRMSTHSVDIPWPQVLTFIAARTMEYSRRGEPGETLQPVEIKIHQPEYYIEPLIMKGVPNVIFGDKGVNKTMIGLMLLGLIYCGCDESPSGLTAKHAGKVAILDWESNKSLTLYNLARLVESGTVPYCEPAYLRCKQSLADDIDRIATFLHDNSSEVVLIDSLGQAAGSDRFDSSGKAAAIRTFECLRQLNITSLIIGQNAKGEDNRKTIFGSVYYQYYSRNIFELKKVSDGKTSDDRHIALIHQDSNYSKLYPPIGFHITFTETSILVETEEITLAQLKDRIEDTEAIMEFLRGAGRLCSSADVAEAIDKTENRARVVLSILKKKGKVVNPSRGLWGLKAF